MDRLEKIGIGAAKVATGGGAITSFFSGLSTSDLGVIVGILLGVIGVWQVHYWQKKRAEREERLNKAIEEAISKGAAMINLPVIKDVKD